MDLSLAVVEALIRKVDRDENGAIGWLLIGIIVGVLLVVAGIIKLLIPGD